MKHMRPLNKKAARIDDFVAHHTEGIVALQDRPPRPHIPMGARSFCGTGYLRLFCGLLLAGPSP
jgi:hypothetical protein